MKKYWTHGDKTGASEAKNAEWKKKCDASFKIFVKARVNQYLNSDICKHPYWKISSRVYPEFEYISKDYRDYKKDPTKTNFELAERFKLFDAIVDRKKAGTVEEGEAAIRNDPAQNLATFYEKIQIPENHDEQTGDKQNASNKLTRDEQTGDNQNVSNKLTPADVANLIKLSTGNDDAKFNAMEKLESFTDSYLNNLKEKSYINSHKSLVKLIDLVLQRSIGGRRKTRRKQRRNRKTRRFF
jgi:hypothetical protein